jgi:signal transduction histidine kinase
VLDAQGNIVAALGAQPAAAATPVPLAPAEFRTLAAQSANAQFFADVQGLVLEACIRPLTPSAQTGSARWLLATRSLDQAFFDQIAALTGATLTLEPPAATAAPPENPAEIVLLRPLTDAQGRPLRQLRLDYHAPELTQLTQAHTEQVALFAAFGLMVIAAMWLAMSDWVLHPLQKISTALATGSNAPLTPLAKTGGEVSTLAALVARDLASAENLRAEVAERTRAQAALEKSEAALRRTMEERAQLGRDLHDSVIQSLYAAGMGLSGVRAQLQSDQVEAAARLEQTGAVLNETIHDLRNYINGLEPASIKLHSFGQALASLLEVLRSLRPAETIVTIDEAIAAQLTLAQRVHALQIAREAVSNALRHGQANRVAITLRAAGENVEFQIDDDGLGFDPAGASPGLGLTNFADRARELGAHLSVDSSPGNGTHVRLVFSLFRTP